MTIILAQAMSIARVRQLQLLDDIMWKAFLLCMGLLVVSGCVANDSPRPDDPDLPAATMDAPQKADADIHTLSVELTIYEGGSAGARAYAMAQAEKICEGMGKKVDVADVTTQTTWRGGTATVSFYCK